MPTRIFRVDLSDDARDFAPLATEPGLAMLDRPGANYSIMRRWLGDHLMEPEWPHPEATTVHFFAQDEERGRLENIECSTVKRSELEKGPLRESLDQIGIRLRKAKFESVTEETLHKVALQTFKEVTKDFEQSDPDCFFLKIREPNCPWQLVWAWGFQRADLQPGRATLCTNPECNLLYFRREKTKALCPSCQKLTKRKKSPLVAAVTGVPGILFLLLLATLLYFGWPRLEVTPGDWDAAPGDRLAFKAKHTRWFFFSDDVTTDTTVDQFDRDILSISSDKTALARVFGLTDVTFSWGDKSATVKVAILPKYPPQRLAIMPGEASLGVGSTVKVRVMGEYDDRESIDITKLTDLALDDESIAKLVKALLEGASEGETELSAHYAKGADGALSDKISVLVKNVKYLSLSASVNPTMFDVHEQGKIRVTATGEDGKSYSLLGSSKLTLGISPETVAKQDGDYAVGMSIGKAEMSAKMGSLGIIQMFRVGAFDRIALTPKVLNVKSGEEGTLKVRGILKDGTEVDLSPDELTWEKLPFPRFARFDRSSLEMIGLTAGPDSHEIIVRVASGLTDSGSLFVSEGPEGSLAGEFGAHPPVALINQNPVAVASSVLGPGSNFLPGNGIQVGTLPPGSPLAGLLRPNDIIRGINGVRLTDLAPGAVQGLLDVLGPGDVISGPGYNDITIPSASTIGVVDVQLLNFQPFGLTDTEFSASLTLNFVKRGTYVITDADGEAISQSQEYGPDANVTITTNTIPRTADDEYELYVERTIDGKMKRFQLPISLTEELR